MRDLGNGRIDRKTVCEAGRISGQGLVEYGLILGLISVLILTMFVMFNNMFGFGSESGGAVSDESLGGYQASLSAQTY